MSADTPTISGSAGLNCLAFRRAKLADPNRLTEEALAHSAGCPLCQAFARRIDANEKRLSRALAVAVPDGLADRIVLRATGRKPASPYRLWALAATVLLTSGIGLAWLNRPASEPQYDFAASAIAHVKHEPESFTTVKNADPARFATILADFGADMQAPIGKVRYVKLCPVPEGTGWHIVFETEDGLVTLMLIPGHQPRGKNLFAEAEGMSALVRAAGQGYYVIVADSRAKVESTDRLLKQRINWTALRAPSRLG
jgi:hypothetical protein